MSDLLKALDRLAVHVPDYELINNGIVEISKELDLAAIREALSKQVGVYPDNLPLDEVGYYKVMYAHSCPTCQDGVVARGESYCSECGQKIKWEQEEEKC